jgi:F0F1-type ATP synthase assembly protein I
MQHNETKKNAYRFVLSQVFLTLVLSGSFWFESENAAISALKGGLIAAIVNVVFLLFAFRFDAEKQPQHALGAMQRGQSFKLVFAAVLLAMVLQNKQTEAAPLLLTYVAVVVLQCFKGFFFKH